jgi:ferredoxin like protein
MPETAKTTTTELPEVYIDDILMSLKYYTDEHEAHVKIIDPQACIRCGSKSCVQFCPVGAYRTEDGGTVQIAFQSCIECGTCRVMCPSANVSWKLPRGGFGVSYKFG